jgi:hypothetical protein
MPSSLSFFEASSNVVPLIDNVSLHAMSDDECVKRLASAVDRHDESKLNELAALISRLAVPIEL